MKKITPLYLLSLVVLAFTACGSQEKTAKAKGIEFDSIVIDSTYHLIKGKEYPSCHLKLNFQYAKGEKADEINHLILHSGIINPELATTAQKLDVKQVLDSFVTCFFNDYKTDYGVILKEEPDSPGLNYAMEINTTIKNGREDIVTYLADIYYFAGGAHGISHTLARNIDVNERKIVTLGDLFIENHEKQLHELIVKEMTRKFNCKTLAELQEKEFVFADANVYAPENFILNKNNITFIYCDSEIAPHAAGEIRIEIDYDDLRDILKK